MTTLTRCFPNNVRIFTSLFISFIILVTPIAPVFAAKVRQAGYVKSGYKSSTPAQPGAPLSPPASTVVTATKADSFNDPNGDGKAEEGDTITYDVNVSNTGANDATGVTFTDTIDPNTTLVPGSLKVSPLAFADTYNATKDVALNISAPGVLSNDTGTPAPTAQTITAGATSAGGTVTLNADGSFNYTPASGYTGPDSFTYTVTNGLTPNATATVTINVDEGPTVTNTTPANGAINVAPNSNITVNFSEPVNATTGSFTVECPGGSPQAFTLSASPAASFTLDPVADLPAGQTCTVTVLASQITDADTFDPPDQLAANYVFSFGVKPDAVDDMHSATGNVRINTAVSGYSVLTNDIGGAPITAFDSTSVHGGNVTMNTATGTFTYDPPRGFTGTDSFTYTVSNANGSDVGTVVLTVTDMIWFINNAAPSCAASSCGRLTSPYDSLSAFEAANGNGTVILGAVVDPEAGDDIFIYTGSGSYTGPLTLEDSQIVIGQGATSSIGALTGITLAPDSDTLPSTGGTKPTITSSSSGITLAQNDQLHGLAFSNTAGAAIDGAANVGTLLMSDIAISNTSGQGIALTGGGTVTATGVNTISTTTGTALNVANTGIGTAGLTFASISANGAVNGIALNNTGTAASNGGLTVTGTGSSDSGGTIQNSTGDAILLSSTKAVSLTDMQITASADNAVDATTVVGLTLDSVDIATTGNDGIRGNTVTDFKFQNGSTMIGAGNGANESGIFITNLFGANSAITGSSVTGSQTNNLRVINNSPTAGTLTINGSTFSNTSVANGGDAVSIQTDTTGNLKVKLTGNNNLNNSQGDGIQTSSNNSSVLEVTINGAGSNYNGNLGSAVNIASAHTSQLTALVSGFTNLSTGTNGVNGLNVINIQGFDTSTINATVQNNTITGLGNNASGIRVIEEANGTINANLNNNNISGLTASGITAQSRNGTGLLSMTVNNNTINLASTLALDAINIESGSSAGGTNTICLNMFNNNSAAAAQQGYRLRQRAGSTFQLQNFSGNGASTADVTTWVNTTKSNTGTTDIVIGTAFTSSGGCSTTTLPSAMLMPEMNQQQQYFALNDVHQRSDSSLLALLNAATSASSSSAIPTAEAASAKPETMKGASLALAHARSKQAQGGHPKGFAASIVAAAPPSGETVTATIGTLPAAKTVRIQFQVTVNSSLPSSVTQVSNQGTVSGDNFTSVLTDDPAAGGSSDPTVTPILTPPDIRINDASVAEPASGTAPMAFTVTLSHAFSQAVTVSYSTANGGANPATAGSDYTTSSGTVTFSPGQTVKTISVPVLADGDNSETAETFLVNISGANVGTITDSQATGTINPNGTPGTVLISELRTSGPGGADDEFVEILNNTDSDITVSTTDSSAGWAVVKSGSDCSETPVIVAVIPNGTIIPARGNYLLAGSAYSLGGYTAPDQTYSTGIEDDHNVALFNTADLSNLATGTRLDAVGFGGNAGGNCDLLSEGANLPNAGGSTSEYSFVRKVSKGETSDAGDNATDFVVVSTTPATAVGGNTPTLGAPGPEGLTSPRGPQPCSSSGSPKFDRARLDSSVGVGAAPNTVRDTTTDSANNSTYGTLDVRRRFTNNSGGSVTRLRFRIVDLTTTPTTTGNADLRARTSSAIIVAGVNDAATCNGSAPCSVTVNGTTLETPPAQALGGGVNSTLGAGTITLATPLNNGASVNLRFLFGVQQEGDYRIGIVIEDLTTGSLGQDIWVLRGNTQTGGHTDGGCNTPPVANAGADQNVECAGGTTSVTLDGTASTDPDGDTPLTYEWREGVTVLGNGATLNTSFAFGSHTITLKVTDPSGDFSEDTVTINVVDTSDPMITPPPNVTVNTGPGATDCSVYVSDATLGSATASDGCSASVTVNRTGVPSGNIFPVGQTTITYTADDGHGHTKQAFQTVTVIDNTPPTVNAPADQEVNAPANSCSASVDPGTATGNDNCPGVNIVGVRSDSQPLNAPYPVGTTTITWTATDDSGNQSTDSQTIKVKDSTPPTIVVTSNVISLSPPNHQYQTFTIAQLVASVSDLCDSSVDISDVVISKVTSDEPEDANGNGDGNTLNDIVITPDCKSLQVRAERSGNGNGRVYTVTLQVKDSSGNVATATRKIFVPNSGPVVDSGVQYTVNGCTP
jgi:hypothetical protein